MKKLIKLIKKPSLLILYLMNKGILNWVNDEKFLKIKYRLIMGKKLNLENPKTFNEKIQWLKLYDRKDIYTTMVDKYEAKKYVANIIGEKYIIPTLGIYNSFEEIDFSKLPNQFVIKPTHTSGNIYICKDKNKIDYKKLEKEINKWLKRKYYYIHREWPYKNIKPRIIIEKFMIDKYSEDIKDYKLMSFNGKVKYSLVCSGRSNNNGLHMDFYDLNWNKMPFKRIYPNLENKTNKPFNYQTMIKIAEKLSHNIMFLRVDFYEINQKIYFGELTFYPSAGFGKFIPEEYDEIIGDMLEIK